MGKRITIPFVGGTAKDRSIQVNNQSTVNLINAIKGAGAKAPVVLESAPGLVDQGTAGNGVIRSSRMRNWQGDLYAVFGTELVKIATVSGVTVIGTLNANTGRVVIARGRTFIALVDGTNGYTYDGTTFLQITDADFPGNAGRPNGKPTHISYQDGFFIVNDAATDDFLISAIEDPTSWNALDFEAASVAPDNSLAFTNSHSILYIHGDDTTQLYYNTGNADFPYELIQNATQEVGIAAPDSLSESDEGVFFLATTPEGGLFVYQILGQDGRVITRDEQEAQLADVTSPSTAYGFLYKQAGKTFYVLQLDDGLPSSQTLVFNIKAQVWESREIQDGTGWRAGGHGVLANRNLVGSRLAARFYELDLSIFDDAGQEMIGRRVTQIIHSNGELLDWHEVTIDIAGGVGTIGGPGADPKLRFRHTNDRGVFSAQLIAPMGKIGETDLRARFFNLGVARDKRLEIEISAPVARVIKAAYAVVTVLQE